MLQGAESTSVTDLPPRKGIHGPFSSDVRHGSSAMPDGESDPKVAGAIVTLLQSMRHGMDKLGDFMTHLNNFGRDSKPGVEKKD